MKVIITMAGMGSRFRKIGINKPKHEIIARGKTLFEWSMLSLIDFFDNDFIFIVRKGAYNREFILEKSRELDMRNAIIIETEGLTDGQATTALLADKVIKEDEGVVIYNIDTYVKEYSLKISDIDKNKDGFIPVFKAEGDKWSFVKVNKENEVIDVVEKRRISDLGTLGLYYFKSWSTYKKIYYNNKEVIKKEFKEVYIAPMYKKLLEDNGNIGISIIDNKKIYALGTPEDVEKFDKEYLLINKC